MSFLHNNAIINEYKRLKREEPDTHAQEDVGKQFYHTDDISHENANAQQQAGFLHEDKYTSEAFQARGPVATACGLSPTLLKSRNNACLADSTLHSRLETVTDLFNGLPAKEGTEKRLLTDLPIMRPVSLPQNGLALKKHEKKIAHRVDLDTQEHKGEFGNYSFPMSRASLHIHKGNSLGNIYTPAVNENADCNTVASCYSPLDASVSDLTVSMVGSETADTKILPSVDLLTFAPRDEDISRIEKLKRALGAPLARSSLLPSASLANENYDRRHDGTEAFRPSSSFKNNDTNPLNTMQREAKVSLLPKDGRSKVTVSNNSTFDVSANLSIDSFIGGDAVMTSVVSPASNIDRLPFALSPSNLTGCTEMRSHGQNHNEHDNKVLERDTQRMYEMSEQGKESLKQPWNLVDFETRMAYLRSVRSTDNDSSESDHIETGGDPGTSAPSRVTVAFDTATKGKACEVGEAVASCKRTDICFGATFPISFWDALVLLRSTEAHRSSSHSTPSHMNHPDRSHATPSIFRKVVLSTVFSCCGNDSSEGVLSPNNNVREDAGGDWEESMVLINHLRQTPLDYRNVLHQRVLYTIYYLLVDPETDQSRDQIANFHQLREYFIEKEGKKQEEIDCPVRPSLSWESIGFQGSDPATDLRATGILGLFHLLYLLTCYPLLAQKLWMLCRPTCLKVPSTSHIAKTGLNADLPFVLIGFNFTAMSMDAFDKGHFRRSRAAVMSKVESDRTKVSDFRFGTGSFVEPGSGGQYAGTLTFPVLWVSCEYYIGCIELFANSWERLVQRLYPIFPTVADFAAEKSKLREKLFTRRGGEKLAMQAARRARNAH